MTYGQTIFVYLTQIPTIKRCGKTRHLRLKFLVTEKSNITIKIAATSRVVDKRTTVTNGRHIVYNPIYIIIDNLSFSVKVIQISTVLLLWLVSFFFVNLLWLVSNIQKFSCSIQVTILTY